jgi:protein KRI1
VEERYGKDSVKFPHHRAEKEDDSDDGGSESSSEDEDEDDEGEFATADLDAEINDTLNAIRSKDPRVYDKAIKFYKDFEPAENGEDAASKQKAMTLKDYHRKNFLAAARGDTGEDAPKTYVQEQADLKGDLIRALQDAADEAEESNDEDDSFLKAKEKPAAVAQVALPDPTTADKDPENYLSNFFAARAWVPTTDSRFAHLESDDDEEDLRADEFEEAYNLRFEDPEVSNQKLVSHSRDAVAQLSARREEMSSRKKARERERQKKEEEKTEREAEKARLRKLKVEQMESKIDMIRKAAGGRNIDIADWANVLEEDWDDSRFDEEMRKRFGDEYYQEIDEGGSSSDEEGATNGTKRGKKKRKPEKPTWDDDIDIKDLIPDFEEDDQVILSDEDETAPSAKSIKQQKASQKASSRRDRRMIESLVDQSLALSSAISSQGDKNDSGPRFSYRETSPSSFGLTTLDILAADDAHLNQWAGIKKLAAFRDPKKKDKDKKRLSKKGRLREWRKETFGRKEGPGLEDWYVEGAPPTSEPIEEGEGVDIREGSRKKRKRGKKKVVVDE